jgi:hypothetical protein
VSFSGAARRYSFAAKRPDNTKLGFDLDGLCTCHPDNGSCISPNGPKAPCDDPDGIDNAANDIIKNIFLRGATGGDATVDVGKNGIGIQIDDYNGGADDQDVTVQLYNVVGIDGDPDGGQVPAFDGNDKFVVEREQLTRTANLTSQYIDTQAYVKGGVLVARFPKLDVRFVPPPTSENIAGRTTQIPLTQALFVSRISVTGGQVRLSSTQLIGRMTASDALREIARIGTCPTSPDYQGAKQITCNTVDTPSDPNRDGKGDFCDAISFAIGVEILPGKLTGSVDAGVPVGLCGDVPVDKCR